MEPNIVFAITAIAVVLAAVILTYRFGPRRSNLFILDLFEAVSEPVRPISAERRNSRRGTTEDRRISSRIEEASVAGDLCNVN